MASTVRPRGPLPARVYWTGASSCSASRCSSSSCSHACSVAPRTARTRPPRPPRRPAPASPSPPPRRPPARRPSSGRTARARRARRSASQKSSSRPSPCSPSRPGRARDSDIVATPALTTATGGADVPITVNLRTVVAEACTWQVSPQTLTLTITSGSDFIWSTRECPTAIPVQDVVVRQAVTVVVTWADGALRRDVLRSHRMGVPRLTTSSRRPWAGEGTDVQFELVAPQPAVVTTTADPKPGKKKDKKNGDTSHTPGEDGAGNLRGLDRASGSSVSPGTRGNWRFQCEPSRARLQFGYGSPVPVVVRRSAGGCERRRACAARARMWLASDGRASRGDPASARRGFVPQPRGLTRSGRAHAARSFVARGCSSTRPLGDARLGQAREALADAAGAQLADALDRLEVVDAGREQLLEPAEVVDEPVHDGGRQARHLGQQPVAAGATAPSRCSAPPRPSARATAGRGRRGRWGEAPRARRGGSPGWPGVAARGR